MVTQIAQANVEILTAARMDPQTKINQSTGIAIWGHANLAGVPTFKIVDFARPNTQSTDVKRKEE